MLRRILPVLVAWAILAPWRSSPAQFSELARRIPSGANAIVFIDAEKCLASPAAVKGNWKDKIDNQFAAGITLLPPETNRAILVSHLDLEFMSPIWQTALVDTNRTPETPEIAKNLGGTEDRIGAFPAVRLPHDAYVVRFSEKMYGMMAPANRQAVGTWLKDVQDRNMPSASEYLRQAYHYANDIGTPIVMAIELEGAVSEAEIRSRLRENWKESGFDGKADPLAVAKVLASIRGATLGITLRDEPYGALKIDFAEDAAPLSAIAKPLVLHVLDRRGVSINEFSDWEYETSGKHIQLKGHFTSSGMRRIFSTFDRPPSLKPDAGVASSTPKSTDPATQPVPLTTEQKAAQATQAYFKSVQHLLKDLKDERKDSGGTYTTGSIAQWCDNYSRKIGGLPLLNVDPEMVDYGMKTAQTLTQASLTLRGGNVQGGIAARSSQDQVNTYNRTETYGYTYRWGLMGGGTVPLQNNYSSSVVDVAATTAQRANIKANYTGQSSMQARQILSSIDADTAAIRAKMVQKYQVEF